MQNEHASFLSMVNGMPDAVIWFDLQQRILMFNQGACEIFGYLEKEALQMTLGDLLPPLYRANHMYHVENFRQSGQLSRAMRERQEIKGLRKNGTIFPAEASISRMVVQGDEIFMVILRDISDRQASEQALLQASEVLRKSNEQLALAIEGSGVGLWDWMVQTGELSVNARWAGMLGYTLEELQPLNIETWFRLTHPDDLKKSNELLKKHFTEKTPFYELETRMRHKNGPWVWILDRGKAIEWDKQGNPTRMTGTHLDITERRMMEEKLRYRLDFENLLTQISTHFINLRTGQVDKEITNSLAEIGKFEKVDRSYIFLIDYAQRTTSNSHEWCREGIEPQIDVLQNIPLDTLPWWMKKLEKNEPIVVSYVENLPAAASAEKEILQAQDILSVTVVPLFVNNQLLGFAGFDCVRAVKEWGEDSVALLQQYGNILGNLMERRRVENALRRSEEHNIAILRAIPDNMFRVNQDGMILDFIASDIASLVIPADQIRGASLDHVLGQELASIALEKIRNAIASGQKQSLEYQLSLQDQVEHFEARIVASGENEVIAIVRNVSERARLEQMKSDFINRATHELRTPITTILLMVRLLETGSTDEERKEYWNILKEEVNRERALIEDLLMVERLERNQWVVKSQPVNPLESLRRSIQTVVPQAIQKDVTIHLVDSADKFLIISDASSLEQIFTNLISNAVKFTPPQGKVEIRYFQGEGKGCFQIKDTGIGIPAEDLPNLFNRFFRARNAIDNEVPGSGIGLFIVKSMIENFGGGIALESSLGQGTSVNFWLPLADEFVQVQ